MDKKKKKEQIYEFADFRLVPDEGLLLRNSEAVSLTPKAFDALLILVERHGRLVEKSELIDIVWENAFVEEAAVSRCIWTIRNALGEDSKNQRFIQTVPKRGYRFVAKVSEVNSNGNDGPDDTPKPTDLKPISNGRVHRSLRPNKISSTQPAGKSLETDVAISAPKEEAGDIEIQPAAVPRLNSKYLPIGIAGMLLLLFTAPLYYFIRTASSSEIDRPAMISDDSLSPLSSNARLRVSRLSLSGNTPHATISPDGKTVVYSKGSGNEPTSIWLRNLESGSHVEIVPLADVDYGGLDLGPDGNFVYFSRKPRTIPASAFELYRVPSVGGVPSRIIGDAQGWLDVSEDGKMISFVRCELSNDEYCSLWIADAKTGENERKMVSRPKPVRISSNAISPDGTKVAFAVGQSRTGSNDFGIAVVDIQTGQEELIADKSFFNIQSLVWSPDSRSVFATAAKAPNKQYDLWDVRSGNAIRLTHDSESYYEISVSRDKTKLLATTVRDAFALKIWEVNSPASPRSLSVGTHAAFSPMGSLVFSSQISGNDEIWSMNQNGSNLRQLTNDDGQDNHPVISEDGRFIFFTSNRSGVLEIWRMNNDGSGQIKITNDNGGFPLRVSQDSEWLYYHHAALRSLFRVPVNGGDAEVVIDVPAAEYAVSPGATSAAYHEIGSNVLVVSSLAEPKSSRLFRFGTSLADIIDLAWDVNHNFLNIVVYDPKKKTHFMWSQNMDGSEPKLLVDLGPEAVADFHFSPDGSTFLFTQGGWWHDILLLEGLK